MIGVKGQYIYSFSLGEKKDFIDEPDLEFFMTQEEAGNVLPTFELVFTTRDEDVPALLNEGSELLASFGKDLTNDIDDVKLLVQKASFSRQGTEKINCTVKGILSKLEYHKINKFITDKQDGIQTIKNVVSKNFIFDSNVSLTNDKMNWIQYNISDKKFINDVWLHTYIPNSFLAVAISLNNKFILRDIKKKFQSATFDWNLTAVSNSEKDIVYDGDYVIQNNSGWINAWTGYKRTKSFYDLEDGEFTEVTSDVKPIIALTNKLMRNVKIEKKNSEIGYISDNVHSNYWKAYLNNLSSLAIFSTVEIKLSFQNQFKKVQVLDSVMFKEINTTGKNSMEYSSGLYIISKVIRILSKRQFITTLTLVRESFNQPKGNLL